MVHSVLNGINTNKLYMKQQITRSFIFFLLLTTYQVVNAQSKLISDFNAVSINKQSNIETQFDGQLSSENIGQTIKQLSAKPHEVGSVNGKAVAESILSKFNPDCSKESFNC